MRQLKRKLARSSCRTFPARFGRWCQQCRRALINIMLYPSGTSTKEEKPKAPMVAAGNGGIATAHPSASSRDVGERVSVGSTRTHLTAQPEEGTQRRALSKAERPIPVEPGGRRSVVEISRAKTLWEDRGWSRSGNTYVGSFVADGWKSPGEIIWSRNELAGCFISNPPPGLWRHAHRVCFSPVGDARYAVHFKLVPENVDSTITTVEQILREAKRL